MENAILSSQTKLPKIDIPNFDENIRNFIGFRNLFENLVHTNTALPNVQKLYLKKNSLEGKVSSLVKDFSITDIVYAEVWSTHTTRCENTKKIIRTLLADFS